MTSSSQRTTQVRESQRLHALDALRAIAVLGMIYMHVSPTGWFTAPPFNEQVPALNTFESLITGRAMSLFVLMAGISAALMTGGSTPHTGKRLALDRRRLALRATGLFIISLLVDQLSGLNLSILEYYTVWLLLLIPLLKLPPRTLLMMAGAAAVIMPVFCFTIVNFGRDWPISPFSGGSPGAALGLGFFLHPGGWLDKLKQLFFGGGFQTPYALALLFAGLAIGRLNLRIPHVRRNLTIAGAVLTASAWLLSRLALGPLGGAEAIAAAMSSSGPMLHPWISVLTLPPHQLYALSIPMTPFMFGIGLMMLGGLAALLQGEARRRLLWPLTATGRLALTWYAAHQVFIERVAGDPPYPFTLFAGIVVFALVFSPLWLTRFERGPLEWLLQRVTVLAGRPPGAPSPAGRHQAGPG